MLNGVADKVRRVGETDTEQNYTMNTLSRRQDKKYEGVCNGQANIRFIFIFVFFLHILADWCWVVTKIVMPELKEWSLNDGVNKLLTVFSHCGWMLGYFQPKTKNMSRNRRKFTTKRSARRLVTTFFWNSRGPIVEHCMPGGTRINRDAVIYLRTIWILQSSHRVAFCLVLCKTWKASHNSYDSTKKLWILVWSVFHNQYIPLTSHHVVFGYLDPSRRR